MSKHYEVYLSIVPCLTERNVIHKLKKRFPGCMVQEVQCMENQVATMFSCTLAVPKELSLTKEIVDEKLNVEFPAAKKQIKEGI